MKLPRKKRDEVSATISQSLWLILLCSGLFVLTAYATDPSWWSTPGPNSSPSAIVTEQVVTNGPVVTTNFIPNNYAVVIQGQLKQFTARAVDELNTNLPGGAGPDLTNLVYGWQQDYLTNGYATNSANPTKPYKPSDFIAMNAGQLKYVGNLVWTQLLASGYTNAPPYWLDVNTNSDTQLANLGQLKTVFAFDLSSYSSEPEMTSVTTTNGTVGGTFSYTITGDNSPTNFTASGLPAGLTLDSSNGVISGTPTTGGTYTVVISETNGSGTTYSTLTLNLGIPVPAPAITSATNASGMVGVPFDYTITADNNPTSFGVTNTLPSGLSVDPGTGVISGIPTTDGTSTLTLEAINAGGTSTTNLALTITDPSAPVITSGTNVSGDVGVPFSYVITANNNPTNFSVTNSYLSADLSLDSNTGEIYGTPSATGTTNVTLEAANSGGTSSPVTLMLIINNAESPIITSPTVAYATTSNSFSYPITATSNPTSYAVTGALPSGLCLGATNGMISGTPTDTDTYVSSVVISASNSYGTGSSTLTFSVNPLAPVITSGTNASGSVGTAFTYTITGTNDPTSFSAAGLPPGLSVAPGTGVISGVPTTTGTNEETATFPVALGATNPGGTGTATLMLTIDYPVPVPVINSTTVVTGDEGAGFTYDVTTISSVQPTSYSATGLPMGLYINPTTGVITGSTTETGTFTVTLTATNALGTGTQVLTLTINSATAPIITSPTMATGTNEVPFSYTITTTNSVTSYSASGLPLGLSLSTTSGLISGTPEQVGTSTVTLNATNSAGIGTTILTLTIDPPVPVITSPNTASGTYGVAFAPYTIAASNNPTTFSATGLPPGLIVNSFTGVISGTPTNTGTYTATLDATNATGTSTATLTVTIAGTTSPIATRSIASGYEHSLILNSSGIVLGMANGGIDYTDHTASFTQISGFGGAGVISIAAGSFKGFALTTDGKSWVWGSSDLGDGSTNSSEDTPVQLTGLSGTIAFAGGVFFSTALEGNGTVWGWGADYYGSTGDGIPYGFDELSPVEVLEDSTTHLTGITAIGCGLAHALAVRYDASNNGTVWTWGENDCGQLGNGTVDEAPHPYAQQIAAVPGFPPIVSVTGGEDHSIALGSDGTVWAWGDNSDGELGTGVMATSTNTAVPVQITDLAGITAISSGSNLHTLALQSDGTVWAWGDNTYGQLGDGVTGGTSWYPVPVSNLTGVIAISAGFWSSMALKSDGTVWAWGYNDYLDTTNESYNVPQLVADLQTVSAPTITPAAGTYATSQTITISNPLSSGTIYYTLDGTTPTTSSTAYTGPLTSVTGDPLVSAAVFVDGVMVTPVASSQFYIDDSTSGLADTVSGLSASAAPSGTAVNLSWTPGSLIDYSAVNIYRSSDNGATYQLIATLAASAGTYTDTNVQSGTTYKYIVGTLDASGINNSAASSCVTPTAPTPLTITVTSPSGATNLP